jgi:transcriptional regulator with XRE-family HTH domain
MPRQKQEKLIEKAIRLLRVGKSQQEVAEICGVSKRSVQRWSSQNSEELQNLEFKEKAIIHSDPIVLTVTEVRQQVQEILDYRDFQRTFAVEMGEIVQKTSAVLLRAIERLEANPDELNVRLIPQLMRALTDAAEKTSTAWVRTSGLDGILEELALESKAVKSGSEQN